jgi:hypothetical protein
MKRYLILLALFVPGVAFGQSAGTRFVSVTPVIDTAVYASGDVMSATAMTFQNLLKPNGARTGYVVSATISDAAAQAIDLDLVLFSALPESFGADNAAFAPTDAQIKTILGVINFGSASRFAFSNNSVKFVGSLAIPVKGLTVPGTIYGVLVARGAYDADAADDLTVTLGAAQD